MYDITLTLKKKTMVQTKSIATAETKSHNRYQNIYRHNMLGINILKLIIFLQPGTG